MGDSLQILVLALVSCVIYAVYIRGQLFRKHLPPGPTGYPLIGNLLDFPRLRPWETFHHWTSFYGDVIYIRIFRMRMVILNSATAASALLDKRASKYSHRPWFTMLNELMGFDWPVFVQTGDRLRESHRLIHRFFTNRVGQYQPTQEQEAHALLKRLASSPEAFMHHCKLFAANIVLRFDYGFIVKSADDQLLQDIEPAIGYFSQGRFMVDFFPVLKYWPEWLPGGHFKSVARDARQAMTKLRDTPFERTKSLIASGEAEACFVSTLLRDIDPKTNIQQQENMIRDCAATLYAAGTHTTASSMKAFILAMIQYPEVQKRAQEEIDGVIGKERLPTFTDRGDLPYLDCLLRELQRWAVNGPVAMPHYIVDEDSYDGYVIPGNTIVLGNLWAIFRDPQMFPDPERFDPSRYMSQDSERLIQVTSMAFGWGRRTCPGRHLAEASLFIAIASCLATLNFSKPHGVGEQEYKWVDNALREPLPFECRIEVRSDQARALLEAI